jgi:hypothetical protein
LRFPSFRFWNETTAEVSAVENCFHSSGAGVRRRHEPGPNVLSKEPTEMATTKKKTTKKKTAKKAAKKSPKAKKKTAKKSKK